MRDSSQTRQSRSLTSVLEIVLGIFKKLLEDPDMAVPVAAIKSLTVVIERSTASTMMELEVQLRAAADRLKQIDIRELGAMKKSSHLRFR